MRADNHAKMDGLYPSMRRGKWPVLRRKYAIVLADTAHPYG